MVICLENTGAPTRSKEPSRESIQTSGCWTKAIKHFKYFPFRDILRLHTGGRFLAAWNGVGIVSGYGSVMIVQ